MSKVTKKIDNLTESTKPGIVCLTLQGIVDYLEIPEEEAVKLMQSGKLKTIERNGVTYATLDSIDSYLTSKRFSAFLLKAACGIALFAAVFILLVLTN